MRAYKHIFFDLDHTLWDFDTNAKEALQDLFSSDLGSRIPAPFEEFYERYLYHNAKLWARYEKGYIGVEELKWRRMWRTLLDFKVADEALAKEMSTKFLEYLPVKKAVFPHTFEILDYLRGKDYVLHLITNGFEITQRSKLAHSGLTDYFTEIITSEISNSLKPKKEIFDFAIARAGADLSDCIMIGDNQDADMQGAINAGMDCIFVNHVAEECRVDCTHTITALNELKAIL